MKKYVLSFLAIVAFAFYAIFSNSKSAAQNDVALPPTTPNGSNNNNTGQNQATNTLPTQADNGTATNPVTPTTVTDNTQPVTTPTPNPTPAPVVKPKPVVTPDPTPVAKTGQYKDGSYTGPVADAFYGPMQVKAIIQGGKLADVQVLQYPSDRNTSARIAQMSIPTLTQEAIQSQSANVNAVSGATQTSQGYVTSLTAALAQAKN